MFEKRIKNILRIKSKKARVAPNSVVGPYNITSYDFLFYFF
jgi:hypothetical protein